MDISSWQLGNGDAINFWVDKWLSQPLVTFLNIHADLYSSLNTKVNNFINNYSWFIPDSLD